MVNIIFFPRFPSVNGKLLLLDVGSCFNPFAAYNSIDPLAIDLQPAISVSTTSSLIKVNTNHLSRFFFFILIKCPCLHLNSKVKLVKVYIFICILS